jgi:hypothetical protein
MRKENEFGGYYYEMTFNKDQLETIHWALTEHVKDTSIWWGDEALANTLNLIDRIEKELGK